MQDSNETHLQTAALVDSTQVEAAMARKPYSKPILESGDAFEKVVLLSGCNSVIFQCDIPCS